MKWLKVFFAVFLSNFTCLKTPYKLTFAITYRCNAKCQICKIWQKPASKELTLDEISNFFKISNKFSWIDLTGGEPFLREDFIDIVQEIVNNCKNLLLLHIPTNGILTKKITETAKNILALKVPILCISISLDGPSAVHDKLRGVPGSWDRAIETFKQLKPLQGIKVYFGMTISRYNSRLVEVTFKEVKNKYSALSYSDFHFNIAHNANYYGNSLDAPFIEEADVKELAGFVIKNKAARNLLEIPFFFLEKTYIKKALEYLKKKTSTLPCQALCSSCALDPYGNVLACLFWDKPIGNIKESSDLRKIWNSEIAKKERYRIHSFLKCKSCWTPCEAYQSMLGALIRPWKLI